MVLETVEIKQQRTVISESLKTNEMGQHTYQFTAWREFQGRNIETVHSGEAWKWDEVGKLGKPRQPEYKVEDQKGQSCTQSVPEIFKGSHSSLQLYTDQGICGEKSLRPKK